MTEITAGTTVTVTNGLTSDGLLIDVGALVIVQSGGAATNATVNGNETVDAGGSDSAAVVNGGTQDVFGSADNSVLGTGVQIVEQGGTASATAVNGISGVAVALQQVLGTALGTTIAFGGEEDVLSGGFASNTTDNGLQKVESGGTVSNTAVGVNASQNVFGGASITSISAGGEQVLESGGSATTTTINSGLQFAQSGASALDTIVFGTSTFSSGTPSPASPPTPGPAGSGSGSAPPPSPPGSIASPLDGVFVRRGGTITFSGGQVDSAGATTKNTTLSGGYQYVAGTTSNTLVNGGEQYIDNGGTASDTTLQAGGVLEVALGATTSGTVTFADGNNNDLQIDGASQALLPNTTISSFVAGDTIDLAGVPFDSAGQVTLLTGNELQIVENGGTYDLQLGPLESFTGASFNLANDGLSSNGTAITAENTPCFLRGTLIRTDRGEVLVELLSVGDRVITLSGEAKPITWIGTGRRHVTPAKRTAATPIIVRKGALANNVPYHHLHITKGHSLLIDGVLIPVEFLLNYRSILWDDDVGHVEFYHIEVADHDVLFANGAPAETYRDDGNRWLFDNTNSCWNGRPKPPFAPVLTGGPVVDAAWRSLLDRDGGRPGWPLTDDPDLHLWADDRRVDPICSRNHAVMFRLGSAPRKLRIASRAAAPAEIGVARDPRLLGVAVRQVVAWSGRFVRLVDADDKSLTDGFHGYEPDSNSRWTTGDAAIPENFLSGLTGRIDLVLQLAGQTRYIDDGRG